MKINALILALLLAVTASLSLGCSAKETEAEAAPVIEELPVEETAEEVPQETDAPAEEEFNYADLYIGVMNDLYNFILGSGEAMGWGGEIGIEEALYGNHGEESLNTVGYAIRDISGDGIPELLIGGMPDPEYPEFKNTLYALYSVVEGEPICLFEGSARNAFFMMRDGLFLYQGSGGAMYSIVATYGISADGSDLFCKDYYFTHEKDGNFEDIRIYHNTTGDWDPSVSEETDLDPDGFWQIYDELAAQLADPGLAPISEYAVG